MMDVDAMTGTVPTTVTEEETGEGDMTKEAGTDRQDHGDLNVITIMGNVMAPIRPMNKLRVNQQTRKTVVEGAIPTMAIAGSKAAAVGQEEEAVGGKIGIGSTRIRWDQVPC